MIWDYPSMILINCWGDCTGSTITA